MMRDMDLDREVERDVEQEYDVEEERRKFEEAMKHSTIEEMLAILKKKYDGSNLKLRVYIDRENEKYYIDTFAAYSLGLISYTTAGKTVDAGIGLYEISAEMLSMLEEVFEGKIEYVYLRNNKKNDRYPVDLGNNYNDLFDKGNSPSGDDNGNTKDDEMKKIFEDYNNNLDSFGSGYGDIINRKK